MDITKEKDAACILQLPTYAFCSTPASCWLLCCCIVAFWNQYRMLLVRFVYTWMTIPRASALWPNLHSNSYYHFLFSSGAVTLSSAGGILESTNLKRRSLMGLMEEPQALCTSPGPSGATRLRWVHSRDNNNSTNDSCDLHHEKREISGDKG